LTSKRNTHLGDSAWRGNYRKYWSGSNSVLNSNREIVYDLSTDLIDSM
jgi:hypothetical protein